MNTNAVLLAVLCGLWASHGATFTVSQDGRGQFRTVQAAVEAAGMNDVVEILDNGTYDEQVTVDSARAGLTLRSRASSWGTGPRLSFRDTIHVGPKTFEESRNPEKINFDFNGALRLLRTRDIVIDGLTIDGVKPYARAFANVWEGVHPHFFGNVGVDIFMSANVTIRNCRVTNAYYGIYIKDRNEGGIYANANPADLKPWNVVPLSGFGRSGNHLIEYNRIGHNSWAIYFESAWDLSSSIRYNLIYENHHTPEMASRIAGFASVMPYIANNQPGGALLFRDVALTPIAIHNNTFRHNYTLLYGTWQAGVQHLVFNNLFASPNQYWTRDEHFANPYCIMEPRMAHRVKHSIYETQSDSVRHMTQEYYASTYDQAVGAMVEARSSMAAASHVELMPDVGPVLKEGMDVPLILHMESGDSVLSQRADWAYRQGAPVAGGAGGAFPTEAGNRWMEIPFLSLDENNPSFLVPDWGNPDVRKYIKDGGWPGADIRDSDGSAADVGARSMSAARPGVVRLRPTAPVMITDTAALIRLDLLAESGALRNPRIRYCGYVHDVRFPSADVCAREVSPLAPAQTIDLSGRELRMGSNTLSVPVPPRTDSEFYGFFEMVVQGYDAEGRFVSSDIGFFPYRQLDYRFEVTVLDSTGSHAVSSVRAGAPVVLKVKPLGVDGAAFPNTIVPAEATLASGAVLLDPSSGEAVTYPAGITGIDTRHVKFTRAPSGGTEHIAVSGIWREGEQSRAFYGMSQEIAILPGPPARVRFQNPPSNTLGANPPVIDPGFDYDCTVQVYDHFGNNVDQAVPLALSTSDPTKGNIVGAGSIRTDTTGLGSFHVKVTNGTEGDIFTLSASIDASRMDDADLKVGRPLDQLWIFYSDVGAYDATAEIREEVGTRVKVTIWASKDGKAPLTNRTNRVTVTPLTPGLQAYASRTGADPVSAATLIRGAAELWITAPSVVKDGAIEVSDTTDNTLLAAEYATRENIFFTVTPATIDAAWYLDTDADGTVDKVMIEFGKAVTDLSSTSVSLRWFSEEVTATAASLTRVGRDSSLVAADVKGVFSTAPVNRTGGDMEAIVRYAGLDTFVTGMVLDSAAPVIVSARLSPGSVVDPSTTGPDTLEVLFSEDVKNVVSNAPFAFVDEQGNAYSMTLTTQEHRGARYSFLVTGLDGVEYPANGDSIWIDHTAGVGDPGGKTQDNPANRRVPLVVKPRPYRLVTTTGPNPFTPGVSPMPVKAPGVTITRGMVIQVDALINLEDRNMALDGSVVIYDAVGNVLARCDGIDDKQNELQMAVVHGPSTKLYFFWNGRNKQGRAVGSGTYLAHVRVKDGVGNELKEVIRIGVRR